MIVSMALSGLLLPLFYRGHAWIASVKVRTELEGQAFGGLV